MFAFEAITGPKVLPLPAFLVKTALIEQNATVKVGLNEL
jgi:hypothetical protein